MALRLPPGRIENCGTIDCTLDPTYYCIVTVSEAAARSGRFNTTGLPIIAPRSDTRSDRHRPPVLQY
jgi:hypothetical protein